MTSVRLIHWKPEIALEKARILKDSGFDVCADPPDGLKFIKELESQHPDVVIIDLSRLPSQGRDMAVIMRTRKATRHIPIVFVDGDPGKIEQIKGLLPDALYTSWDDIIGPLNQAIRTSTDRVVVPESVFAAYAGKPLPVKLGIKTGSKVALIGAPDGFADSLDKLSSGVVFTTLPEDNAVLFLWFVRSYQQLSLDTELIIRAAKRAPVWIAWPKKGSNLECDLTQQTVRQTGLNAGLVDYKICSVDHDWSALLFTWRGILDNHSDNGK